MTRLEEDLRGPVEAALKPRAPLLRLPPALEQRYEAATWRGRSRGVQHWMLVIAGLGLFWIGIDWMVMPEHLALSIAVRGVLLPAMYLGAAAILLRQRPAWVLGMAVLVPTITLALVTGYLAGLVGGLHAERYNTAALFASFTMTMVLAIPFRFAVAQAVLTVAIFAVCQIGHIGAIADNIELVAFYPASILAALAARRRFERMHRRNFLLALRDELRVGQLAAANNRLTTLSNTDALTGVFNRRHFDKTFATAWSGAVAGGDWIAVMMVDVDHFKKLNDAAGHAEGDRCLQAVAESITAQVRGSDLVARYGGEEFIILLPGADLDCALIIAERVRAAIERLGVINPGLDAGRVVTVSVGVAALRAGAADAKPETVLRAADNALYAAKATGRNYVCGASGEDEDLLQPLHLPSNGPIAAADVPLVPQASASAGVPDPVRR